LNKPITEAINIRQWWAVPTLQGPPAVARAAECRVGIAQGIAHHRAITTSSVYDTDPTQALDSHRIDQGMQR